MEFTCRNTQNVEIHHSTISCGDDCVSIQTGCSNVHVHHINCGPGHGISLGGLGKDKRVRIKTWQGGIGSVKNVSFSNIQVSNVNVPIMIDQYYCDKKSCKNQTGAVAISGVKYDQIIGTYSVQPVHLACSSDIPCTDVDLIDIQLKPSAAYAEISTSFVLELLLASHKLLWSLQHRLLLETRWRSSQENSEVP
ncbi:hypothetical protein M0R45_021763 [Rubus argutus]|uniref:Polygalacturonase n=1 Tax=Rubus argutus TaxID=59490 RepID=A0AAW1XEJ2_RUBAR